MSRLEEVLKDANFIISHTSRPKRDYEQDGIDYHFKDKDYFHKHRDKFLEVAEFRDWYYGTSIDSLREDVLNIGIFNPEGVDSILKRSNINAIVVYIEASDSVRYERAISREKDPDMEEINRRAITDYEDFKNIHEVADIVINTERNAIENIINIIK